LQKLDLPGSDKRSARRLALFADCACVDAGVVACGGENPQATRFAVDFETKVGSVLRNNTAFMDKLMDYLGRSLFCGHQISHVVELYLISEKVLYLSSAKQLFKKVQLILLR